MLRIIYTLSLDLTDPATGSTSQLIVPLDRAGNSPHAKPEPPKQRAIDLRVGDFLRHGDRRYRVESIKAYREAIVEDNYAKRQEGSREGYVVRVADGR